MIPLPSYKTVRLVFIATMPIIAAYLFSHFDVDGRVLRTWADVLELTAFLPFSMANLAWVLLAYALYRWCRTPSFATGVFMFAAVLLASPIGRTFLYYTIGYSIF